MVRDGVKELRYPNTFIVKMKAINSCVEDRTDQLIGQRKRTIAVGQRGSIKSL